jgi:hypothetical protein
MNVLIAIVALLTGCLIGAMVMCLFAVAGDADLRDGLK